MTATMSKAKATTTVTSHTHPDPETLRNYLQALSFPFVDPTDMAGIESYGLEPPIDGDNGYFVPHHAPYDKNGFIWPTADVDADADQHPHLDLSDAATPDLSASSSATSSAHSSMPTTPLLSPTAVHDPPAVPSKTLSSEDDHHTLSERILTWSIDHLHLHALEALVHPEETTCHPAPTSTSPLSEAVRIEYAHAGARVRFLIRPLPPKHEAPNPLAPLAPYVAAVASGLLGLGEVDEHLEDELFEFAADALEF